MHKLAHLNMNDELDRAYLYGFKTKLAEYGLTLQDFVALQEKTAAAPAQAARGIFEQAGSLLRGGKNIAKNRYQGHATTDQALQMARELFDANRGGAALLGGGALAGTGGTAYAMGDADTPGNRMRNMSNQYLGTNFDTQSRLGALFG